MRSSAARRLRDPRRPAAHRRHCGDKTAGPALTVRYRIEWYDNVYDDDPDLQLILRDLDCPPGQSMYCDDALRRR